MNIILSEMVLQQFMRVERYETFCTVLLKPRRWIKIQLNTNFDSTPDTFWPILAALLCAVKK